MVFAIIVASTCNSEMFQVMEARLYYPDSIRARFGRRGEDFKNAVHGSNTREEAEKEIHFFFPECANYAAAIFKYFPGGCR